MPDNIKTKHDADKAISDWLDNQTKQGKVQDISQAHWDEDDDPLGGNQGVVKCNYPQ